MICSMAKSEGALWLMSTVTDTPAFNKALPGFGSPDLTQAA